MKKILLLSLLVAAGSSAWADEEKDTRAPSATPTPAFELEGFAVRTWGSEAKSRELFREPEEMRWSARWSQAFDRGTASLEMSSAETARIGLRNRFQDGGDFAFRFSRDRRVDAFRMRVPFDTTEDLGVAHERLLATYDRPLAGSAIGGVAFTMRRVTGSRPALTADPLSFAPAWRKSDARDTGASAWVDSPIGPARVRIDAGFREDAIRRRLDGADIDMRSDEIRQTARAGVRVEGPSRSALLVGGGYSIESMRGEPTGDRTIAAGTFESGDVDLDGIRQRAAIGAAFLPVASVRTGLTAQASLSRFRGTATESRDLATPQVISGRSRQDLLTADANADVEWAAPLAMTVEARGAASFRRDDGRWSQTFFTSAGGESGRRVEDLVRERMLYTGELIARTAPIKGIRFAAGARVDRESWDVESNEAIDTRDLGTRDRDRNTLFATARARPWKTLVVDARVKGFQEKRSVLGTEPTRDGFEARLRASGAFGPVSFFGSGAYGDDSYELSPVAATTDLAGYAPVELHAKSWIGNAGVAASIGRLRASVFGSHVAMADDLRSELNEFGGDLSAPVSKSVRLGAGARWIHWRDPRTPWDDGSALGGTVTLAGRF